MTLGFDLGIFKTFVTMHVSMRHGVARGARQPGRRAHSSSAGDLCYFLKLSGSPGSTCWKNKSTLCQHDQNLQTWSLGMCLCFFIPGGSHAEADVINVVPPSSSPFVHSAVTMWSNDSGGDGAGLLL